MREYLEVIHNIQIHNGEQKHLEYTFFKLHGKSSSIMVWSFNNITSLYILKVRIIKYYIKL